jgi:hypothetical protein
MRWYLAIRRMTRPTGEWGERVGNHLTWLRDQHERGVILISGPTPDHMTGLYVMRAPSHHEAAAIVAEDPLAQDGLATVEIIDWEVHQILGIGSFDRGGNPEA